MTFLKKLRDAAMKCSKVGYAATLRVRADDIQECIDNLHAFPTEQNMIDLNGAWAHGQRLLNNLPSEADPQPPMSGWTEPARLAA